MELKVIKSNGLENEHAIFLAIKININVDNPFHRTLTPLFLFFPINKEKIAGSRTGFTTKSHQEGHSELNSRTIPDLTSRTGESLTLK